MNVENSGFTRLFSLFLLVLVVTVSLVSGCRLIDAGGDDSIDPAAVSSISGRVVKAADVVASQRDTADRSLLAADVSGATGIAGADAWIESLASDPRFKTVTDASGTYRFNNVPPGEYHVIISYLDAATGKTMKSRSGLIKVGETPSAVKAQDLIGEPAVNYVTGQLSDAAGNFLPEGTVLTLWGQTFTVGKDGFFTSPALPESAAEAEIFVQLPGGSNRISFTAPVVSGVVPAFIELRVGPSADGNHAPAVVVSATVNGKPVSKVNPGTVVTLRAVGSDVDSGDQAGLVPTWSVTAGTLTNGASALEKQWTAPDYYTVATVTVEVKDSNNAVGKARLRMLVGIDNPSQVDTDRPTVALSADAQSVTDSAYFNVTITFNEPVSGFELADISIINATVSDLSTLTAGRVFKVKATPKGAGEVKVSVAENMAVDLSNNKNTASNLITVTNTLTPPKSSEKAITAFSFPALSVDGTINNTNKTISVTVPFGTNVSALIANFTASAKSTVKVGSAAQTSGTTANDFSSPVIYKVTAEDGSIADYTVTVTVTQPIQITSANVTITSPMLGATPQNAAAVEAATANADYTVTGLTWNEALTAGGKFKAGQVYTATVTLTSKNNKKFQAAAFTPAVAGSASVGTTTTTGSAIGNTVSFTVNYSTTGALAVTGIAVTTQPTKLSYAEVTDGTLALNGMVITETNNDGSTNTVTFTAGTAAGYTANPANGAALTNAAHNGQPVTITHTASSKTATTGNLAVSAIVEITAAAVTITAPVLGATPQNAAAVEAATANADYTVTGLTWNEALTAGGKFKAGQVYTATVTLTSKNNKKFQAAAFTPAVAGSASVGTTTTTGSAIGNTVSFTVNYAATGALAVTGIAVTTQPTKLSYAEVTDGTLALNGMVVTETNNDGSTSSVTFTAGTAAGYTANPANGAALTNAAHNGQPVTITHTASSKTATTGNLAVSAIVEITAAAVTITAPVLGATPQNAAAVEATTANTDYTVTGLTWNEALTAGGKFKADQVYTAAVTLTSKNNKKFQAAAFTPAVAGSASVGTTTTAGSAIGNTVSFTVNYAATGALAVTGIAVTTQPTKLSYAEVTDGTLALNGMVVTETNNDGSTNTVTFTDGTASGYTANPANGTALTNATHNGQPVTITHTASTQTAITGNFSVATTAAGTKVTHTANGTAFKVSYAPAGTFPTGDDNSGTQTVAQPFWIGETEVTYELWYEVRTWAVDAARAPNQYTFQNAGREGNDGTVGAAPTPGAKNEPVTTVSWRDAVVWCNALSEMLSKDPVYRTGGGDIIRSSADANAAVVDAAVATGNNGFRLPTEWEWELAARWKNDSSSTDGSILNNGRYWTPGNFASGATANYNNAAATQLAAWYDANSGFKTQDVGQKPSSGNHLGVHDMSGNVWEWCWDIYSGSDRVFRGGGWFYSADGVAVAYRGNVGPGNLGIDLGFRVVRP